MKATELRIGNWVYDEGDITTPIETCYITLNNTEWLNPIPLTEEWLERFGLSKWKNKKIWSKSCILIYYSAKDGFSYGKAHARTKIKYVHQLQNLYFALTSEELTCTSSSPAGG